MFILHKCFVIRSCTCTDVGCIIYLLCNINNFVISTKITTLWYVTYRYDDIKLLIPQRFTICNTGRQVLLKGTVLNQDWFIHLGGELKNQEAKIAGLFWILGWTRVVIILVMSDLLLKFGQRAMSQSGTADCVVEGGCGWPALLYGDFMCQLHLHHNQARRHEAEIAEAAHITLRSSYEVRRTHS